jgi:catechol 2,3-dioxygenase-like lactoylglutathione lyase family enzyme
MNVTGVDLLFLEVNNLEESLKFYRDLLGLPIETNNAESEPPMATLRAGNVRITLAQHLETMLRRGRGMHVFLGVEDIDAFYLELKGRGAQVEPPADEGWGGRYLTIEDPDRYRFFFVTWSAGAR